MSKSLVALLLITLGAFISTAAGCDVDKLTLCKGLKEASRKAATAQANVEAGTGVLKTSSPCSPISDDVKCLLGASCYPTYELDGVIENPQADCLQGLKVVNMVKKNAADKCPVTTCDSGASIAPGLGMITALAMLKMLV